MMTKDEVREFLGTYKDIMYFLAQPENKDLRSEILPDYSEESFQRILDATIAESLRPFMEIYNHDVQGAYKKFGKRLRESTLKTSHSPKRLFPKLGTGAVGT